MRARGTSPASSLTEMDKFDRIYRVDRLLDGKRVPVPMATLVEELECSESNVRRIIRTMREMLRAPIEFDPELQGYRYATLTDGGTFQLPGLWFSARELQALVVLQRLLESTGTGLLAREFAPFTRRINQLLAHKRLRLGEAGARIRILSQAARSPGGSFEAVASATLQRRKLRFRYRSRSKDELTERVVSPQRLSHYRDNWYLDAWDELRKALRSFSIDCIQSPVPLDAAAEDRPEAELNEHFGSAYGIFAGKANKVAILRFSGERARWVADERWHPEQTGQFLTDGRYELRIPYRESRELVMDVLRHGAEVEVATPEALRKEVREALERALKRYSE
jgi:proteasome accessory factor C